MSDMSQITDHTLPPTGRAAGTKWNFHPYSPGLVGGHCIPVDPYYLVHKAEEVGYHPQVILAGRAINDHMPKHVAQMMIKGLNEVGKVIKGSKVLIDFFTKNRVKTALRVGLQFLVRNSAKGNAARYRSKGVDGWCDCGGCA